MEEQAGFGQSEVDQGGLIQNIKKHPLLSYFILAFSLSWLISLPHLLSTWGVIAGDFSIVLYLKQWVGPALAGIIMVRLTEGRQGLQDLRGRIRRWRVGWLWYLFIFLGVPLLVLLGILVLPGVDTDAQGWSPSLLANYPVYFIGIFFGTGLPEEIGWRGFALPRMQQRIGPLKSSLLLGILWAFWHLLSFLLPAHGGGPGVNASAVIINFLIFTVMVVALTIIFTWVYNRTHGGILIAALVHTAIDAPQLVWAPAFLAVGSTNSSSGEMALNLEYLIAFGALAAFLLILTRGELGYSKEAIQEL